MHATPAPPEKECEINSVNLALKLVFELGYIIAIPIVLLGFGGAYADKAYGTSPWILLTGMGFALAVSTVGVFRKIREIQTTEFGSKTPS